jgi:hypothetical protein
MHPRPKLTRSSLAASLALIAVSFTAQPATAQDLHPSRRPSPVGIAKINLGDTYVKITYGRPYMRGRAIFGTPVPGETYLVPFGAVWRTGANEATEITTTGPLLVGGHRLQAGTYSIFTVPGADRWEIRFNPELGLDGMNRQDPTTGEFNEAYDETADILRVEAASHAIEDEVDQFTIELRPTPSGADLVLSWERTEVRVPVQPAR